MNPRLASRLSKLVRMLATDADGEIVATVRALRAALQSEGLDLHDLAGVLAGAEIMVLAKPTQISPAPTWDGLTHHERIAWLKVLLDGDDLGALERERLQDVAGVIRSGMYAKINWRRVRLIDEKLARAHTQGARP